MRLHSRNWDQPGEEVDEGCSLEQGRAKSEPEERKVSNTGHGTGEGGSQTVRSLAKSIQIT